MDYTYMDTFQCHQYLIDARSSHNLILDTVQFPVRTTSSAPRPPTMQTCILLAWTLLHSLSLALSPPERAKFLEERARRVLINDTAHHHNRTKPTSRPLLPLPNKTPLPTKTPQPKPLPAASWPSPPYRVQIAGDLYITITRYMPAAEPALLPQVLSDLTNIEQQVDNLAAPTAPTSDTHLFISNLVAARFPKLPGIENPPRINNAQALQLLNWTWVMQKEFGPRGWSFADIEKGGQPLGKYSMWMSRLEVDGVDNPAAQVTEHTLPMMDPTQLSSWANWEITREHGSVGGTGPEGPVTSYAWGP